MSIDSNCVVEIKENKIVSKGNNVDITEGGVDTYNGCSVNYTKDNPGTLTIEISLSESKECKFSEYEVGQDEEKRVVDTKYLSKKDLRLSLAGTKVIEQSKSNYQLMKNEFYCAVQGGYFKTASIKCGDDEPKTGLQNTCSLKLTEPKKNDHTISCKLDITKAKNPDLLHDITFEIQRSGVKFYGCPAGFELNKTEGICKPCPMGKFKMSESGNCEQCKDQNQYAPHFGASKCYKCDGTVNKTHTSCTSCPSGQRPDGNECKDCPAGTYQEGNECENCLEYKYSLPGFTTCFPCEKGYEIKEGKDGCTACGPGTYNDDPKNSGCKSCNDINDGKYTTLHHGQAECKELADVFCPQERFDSSAVGNLKFDKAIAGQEQQAACHYNNDSFASRMCNTDGQWEDPDITSCDSKKTKEIETINVKSKDSIDKLKDQTKTIEEVAPKDIEAVVSKMSGTDVQTVFNSSTDASIKDLASSSMTVVSNMIEASESSPTDQRIKNDIVNCLENIALLALEHMKQGEDNVSISTASTDVYLVKDAAKAKDIGDSNIRIDVNEKSNIRNLAALVYKDNSAFNPPNSTNKRGRSFIAGKVIGLKHTKSKDNEEISFKMKFKNLKNPNKNPQQKVKKHCKYYSTTNNSWETHGCTTIVEKDGTVVCECNHMTSFAVILSVEESTIPMWVSNLVLGINVAFCVLTLLCTLPFRTFRVRKMTVIQSHSILSLFLLCVTWLIMQDLEISETKPAYESKGCKALAFITHYFLMATFSWIFCCSLTLKSQIVDAVKSFGKKNKNLVKKCMMFGYGFPLLIPSLALLMEFLMKKYYPTEAPAIHYIRELECWYSDIWVYSFILFPIYVFFVVNIVCFIKIMRVIGNARRSNDGSSERRVVKAGFALAFTQGLPWIMHPGVLTGDAAEVFQYLFLITFGLQGLGLFVFNVLFQEEVLKNLCGLLHVKPPLIFLSVVPSKQRRTPNSQTGETSLGTARNSAANNDKCYSNNLTLNSVATVAIGEKSLYQDSSHYNELHESSIVTEHERYKNEDLYSHLHENKARETGGLALEPLGVPPASPRFVRFVAGTRAYGTGSPEIEGQRSPIPGETEVLEHQGPPLM